MKLKLVVASMSILGLVSCPVYAANQAKKSSHHRVMKHRVVHHRIHRDYKDMGSLPIQPVADACTMSQAARTMDEMTQSIGRSMPNPCNAGWFNRVQFSGGINVDAGKWGNRSSELGYQGENYQRLSLNDAYLNVGATVNDWVKAFASISYNTATIQDSSLASTVVAPIPEYSAAYSNNINGSTSNNLNLEQAYFTLGNFDRSPFFVQLGKQFQDFGRYTIHPITRSMTQVMSETLATSAKLGFITSGFHGSVAVFDNPLSKQTESKRATNYVAALGYTQDNCDLGWDAGVAYIHDMIGVNDVAYAVTQNNQFRGFANGYTNRTSGWSLYGDVNSGPFTFGARYVTTQRFNNIDVNRNGINTLGQGAKPYAYGIDGNYNFNAMNMNSNVYVGYQASREAAGLLLPRNRWSVGYNADVYANTNLGIQWDRDGAYNAAQGGTGSNSNLVSLRAAVKFG